MAKKIIEPRVDQADLIDWKDFIYRTTRQGGGFMLLEITNINTTGKPDIVEGSRLEVNGVFYEVGPGNEAVTGSPAGTNATNRVNYIYAVPSVSTDECTFMFSNAAPVWSATKGGWYNENNRAVCRFFWLGNAYNAKVLLEDYNSIDKINSTDGACIASTTDTNVRVINHTSVTPTTYNLPAGIYFYSVRGGDSGAPGTPGQRGAGGTGQPVDGNPGETQKAGSTVTGRLVHHGGSINAVCGRNGGRGGNGGNGGSGNNPSINWSISQAGDGGSAGGGGAGQPSVLGPIIAPGAKAGNGEQKPQP